MGESMYRLAECEALVAEVEAGRVPRAFTGRDEAVRKLLRDVLATVGPAGDRERAQKLVTRLERLKWGQR
jgi:hypothetical protein